MVSISTKVADYMHARAETLETEKDPEKLKLTTHVAVELEEDIRTRAQQGNGNFSWVSDFTPWASSAAKGPSPLDYFIASLGMCHESHYSEESSIMGVTLQSVSITIRAKFDIRPGIGYEEINYETRIQSPDSSEKIQELVNRTEEACFVTNTLKRALPLKGKIYLNGIELLTRKHEIQ